MLVPYLPPVLFSKPIPTLDEARQEGRGAPATGFELKIDRFLSGPGTIAYLAAGLGSPFITTSHRDPTQQALRSSDATLMSVGLAEGLKHIFREPRPDTGTPDSFPSEHAAATFAMATTRAQFEPGQAVWWFLGSTAISVSRVRLNRHRWVDIAAGALLGYGVARLELSQSRGLVLAPFIDRPSRDLSSFAPALAGQGWQPLFDPRSGRLGFSYTTRF